MRSKILLSLLFLGPLCYYTKAQSLKEQSAWLVYVQSVKFSEKWGLHLDVQARSADDLNYVRNVLIRPGLTYFIDSKQNATAGYAYIGTLDNPDIAGDRNLTEHRIWQQYVRSYKINNLPITHRFRLEQRFIERPTANIFAQRFRYMAKVMVPLKRDSAVFSKGVFMSLQNELLLNVQNKEKLNNKLFDQNRASLGLGYRLNKRADIEAGYLNQFIEGASFNTVNHIGQLTFNVRF